MMRKLSFSFFMATGLFAQGLTYNETESSQNTRTNPMLIDPATYSKVTGTMNTANDVDWYTVKVPAFTAVSLNFRSTYFYRRSVDGYRLMDIPSDCLFEQPYLVGRYVYYDANGGRHEIPWYSVQYALDESCASLDPTVSYTLTYLSFVKFYDSNGTYLNGIDVVSGDPKRNIITLNNATSTEGAVTFALTNSGAQSSYSRYLIEIASSPAN